MRLSYSKFVPDALFSRSTEVSDNITLFERAPCVVVTTTRVLSDQLKRYLSQQHHICTESHLCVLVLLMLLSNNLIEQKLLGHLVRTCCRSDGPECFQIWWYDQKKDYDMSNTTPEDKLRLFVMYFFTWISRMTSAVWTVSFVKV